MSTATDHPTTRQRLIDISREIGTLLVAFAPLDAEFAGVEQDVRWRMLRFVFAGILFIALALRAEQRR